MGIANDLTLKYASTVALLGASNWAAALRCPGPARGAASWADTRTWLAAAPF